MSSVLGIPAADLLRISLTKNRAKKGRKRSNGEFVYEPAVELKAALQRIDRRLLREFHFPATFCHLGGKGQISAATHHLKNRFLLRMDVKKFFYSIHSRKVNQIFLTLLGCPIDAADLLTKLTTFDDIVPPGFPTSPRLAALAFLPVEKGLSRLCLHYKVNLSIYGDDLAFSANRDFSPDLEAKIKFVLKKGGFKINQSKTTYRVSNQSKEVVGIKLGTKPNVPDRVINEAKKANRNFRKGIYSTLAFNDQLGEFASLQGLVNYINQINPVMGGKLLLQVNEIKSTLNDHSISPPI